MRDLNITSNRSVERAIDIIDSFTTTKPSLTIDEICELTKLPKATAYRLLYTLERRGVIRYDQHSAQYKLGFKLFEYSQVLSSSIDLLKEAEDILTELQVKTNQTVLMSMLDGDSMVYVFKRENQVGLKYSSSISQRRPLTYGVLGRALIAFLPQPQIDQILSQDLPKWTPHTTTDKHLLQDKLQKARRDLICVETDETNIGVTGIGAPIFNKKGEAFAAAGILGPTIQFSNQELQTAMNLLKEAAHAISVRMGYEPIR